MILDEDLLRLNKEGFIPGPNEKEEDFLKRIDFSKKMIKDPNLFFTDQNQKKPFNLEDRILKPRWNWTRAQLLHLFDVSPKELALFYSDESLHFFQAAATWILSVGKNNIKIPVLQFRKILKRKPYLFIYTLDEILAHEAIHSIRVAFDEPKTEEIFSYMTATSVFRRVLGPIIRSSKEVLLFFSLIGGYFIFQILWMLSFISFFSIVSLLFGISTLSILSYGLIRLFFVKRKCRKTFKKLFKILKNKTFARAVLFRLTDSEIYKFSKMKKEKVIDCIKNMKDHSLRMKMIYLAYFKNHIV
jgi:hypothetical protein